MKIYFLLQPLKQYQDQKIHFNKCLPIRCFAKGITFKYLCLSTHFLFCPVDKVINHLSNIPSKSRKKKLCLLDINLYK